MKRHPALRTGLFLGIVALLVACCVWPLRAGAEGESIAQAITQLRATFPALSAAPVGDKKLTLLNVSYDPTREFYQDYNRLFAAWWKGRTGQEIEIQQSHGGSGKQARAILDGLKADVVTLALGYDISILAEKGGLLPADWAQRLPGHSVPASSTIVLLVRKGNPKHIKDWDDLAREGVAVIMPNPKTSGGARWNYLAAWAYGLKKFNRDEQKTADFMRSIYRNVPVLDTGARGATTTFVQRGMGDVLVSWENDAYLAMNQLGKDEFEVVIPSLSVRAEPPVAVVERTVAARGSTAAAQAYLAYLYSEEAQRLVAKHYMRPADPAIAAEFKDRFPAMALIGIDELGGWVEVQKKHFADGGLFDAIYERK